MFDLEKSIAGWRSQMLAAGINTPVPLEELENHLRDEIEQQLKSGTNAPLAFEAAVQEIGKANMLKTEFEKIDTTKRALTLKQYRTIMVACLGVVSLFWTAGLLLKVGNLSVITAAQQMSGLASVAVMILLAGIGLSGHGPVSLSRRLRDLICISRGRLLALLWVWFFCYIAEPAGFLFILPKFDGGPLWLMLPPAGLLFGFIGGLEKAASKETATADA
ncbi:MAG: hypothetical protein ACLQAH_13985 [Limisphaerales bacterium]